MGIVREYKKRSRGGRSLGTATAALLCVAMYGHPIPADAASHPAGGGDFHGGGGMHTGAAGFHGGGMHAAGGFHGDFHDSFHGEFHGRPAGLPAGYAGAHAGHWSQGFHGNHHWAGGGLVGWTLFPDQFGVVPYDGYYGYGSVAGAPVWYYCSDPPGYYPYVSQCYTAWQTVPAG